jgi:hypothetical protein
MHFLFLCIVTALVSGVAAYVVRPLGIEPAQAIFATTELQLPNRAGKAERHTLMSGYSLRYLNFSPSLSEAWTTPSQPPNISGTSNGLLNNAQIAGIERRLRLTPQQAEHWPPVAAALRNIALQYFQRRQTQKRVAPKIDLKSPEVQRLIEAARPLIQQLREDQKREIRQLVRIIGLERVASYI